MLTLHTSVKYNDVGSFHILYCGSFTFIYSKSMNESTNHIIKIMNKYD